MDMGWKMPPDAIKKIRLKFIENWKWKVKGSPNYNKSSCKYFDWLNMYMGWNGMHAENGGEFYIKELGYWVDYYEPKLNIVIEYDEKHHFNIDGSLKEKDIQRQKEIVELLKCDFYRVKDEFRIYEQN